VAVLKRRINLGGQQGRGNPEIGRDQPPSTWIADFGYDEPETRDLGLEPLTHGERALLRVFLVLAALAMVALAVSCIQEANAQQPDCALKVCT